MTFASVLGVYTVDPTRSNLKVTGLYRAIVYGASSGYPSSNGIVFAVIGNEQIGRAFFYPQNGSSTNKVYTKQLWSVWDADWSVLV